MKSWEEIAINVSFGKVKEIKLVRKFISGDETFFNTVITSFPLGEQKPESYWTEEKLNEFAEGKLVELSMDEFHIEPLD